MNGRRFSAGNAYRYGFNGKENDKTAGEGVQDYGMRIYDGRIGKFLSVDPITKKYPWLTPYQFASDSPIWAIDVDGLEGDKKTDPASQPKHPVQTIEDGYGDYVKRTYHVSLINSKMSAKEIFKSVANNFTLYTTGVSYFEKINGIADVPAVGDEYAIVGGPNYTTKTVTQFIKEAPIPKASAKKVLEQENYTVDEKNQVVHIGAIRSGVTIKSITEINEGSLQSYSFTFSTWKGHVEAGEITFTVSQFGTATDAFKSFTIVSNSKSSNFFTDKAYRFLGGKAEQTKHWTTFLNNLVKNTGASPATPTINTEQSETPIKSNETPAIKPATTN